MKERNPHMAKITYIDHDGTERVVESIRRHSTGTAEELMEGIFADALAFAEGAAEPLDDLTVAVLRADR